MKNIILTLASVAALAGAANAQTFNVQLSQDTLGFVAGDYIQFNSQSDFLAGTNATFVENQQVSSTSGWHRDYGGSNSHAFNDITGSLFNTGQTATWAAGNVSDYSLNNESGYHTVQLSSAVLGFNSGDYIFFQSNADFLAGTNATFSENQPLTTSSGWHRDYSFGGGQNSYAFNDISGLLFNTGQTATWAAGNVSDFAVVQTAVPEPSSTALLGLGGLALILRRKK